MLFRSTSTKDEAHHALLHITKQQKLSQHRPNQSPILPQCANTGQPDCQLTTKCRIMRPPSNQVLNASSGPILPQCANTGQPHSQLTTKCRITRVPSNPQPCFSKVCLCALTPLIQGDFLPIQCSGQLSVLVVTDTKDGFSGRQAEDRIPIAPSIFGDFLGIQQAPSMPHRLPFEFSNNQSASLYPMSSID